ncbi:hypothetical protein PS870_06370 [Pseudomonas fluorescens]|uniref:Uncharacterized protein n=1 Tax=Pseudomonas fluorescens TaxID=294 RepID=A0A5E7QJA2_PSEFL|nr:hypothetical protein [Pseudomonas fluorescens]VVP61555.1 hypothetical protein PS870_06370 [Pseudomonas fluorescens]
MHTEAHFVLEDVLIACKTINVFGDLAVKNLEAGIPNDLVEEEKDELERAFKLMRLTLDFVNPLITASFDQTPRRRSV